MNTSDERRNAGPNDDDESVEGRAFAELDVLLASLDESAAPPHPALRSRILAASRSGRFDRFAGDVEKMMDVARDEALRLLAGLDESEPFEPGPFPLDIALRHIDGGAAVSDAITGFVRIAPGVTFPEHGHVGEEQILILQGYLRDDVTQSVAGPGELVTRPAGSTHSVTALPGGTDVIYLAVVHRGLRIGDSVIGPEAPEL